MKMPSKILVPVDFSEPSLGALNMATSFASLMDAELLLLSVIPWQLVIPEISGDSDAVSVKKKLRETFEEQMKNINLAPDMDISRPRLIVREGNAAEEILRVIQEEDVDLVVMGTHGRRGLSRVLMGSVTEQVIRRATCPVLTWSDRTRQLANV